MSLADDLRRTAADVAAVAITRALTGIGGAHPERLARAAVDAATPYLLDAEAVDAALAAREPADLRPRPPHPTAAVLWEEAAGDEQRFLELMEEQGRLTLTTGRVGGGALGESDERIPELDEIEASVAGWKPVEALPPVEQATVPLNPEQEAGKALQVPPPTGRVSSNVVAQAVRWKVVILAGTLKGITEVDARRIADDQNGTVYRSTIKLYTDGSEELGPWQPV